MASRTRKKKEYVQTWTAEEEELGRVIILLARKHGSARMNDAAQPKERRLSKDKKREIFLECYGKAAQEQGYRLYADLPQGVKSFISWLGGRNSHKNDVKEPAAPEAFLSFTLAELAAMWEEDILSCSTLRHALHPEDEKELIESLA